MFDALFNPKSIALVGASRNKGSVGHDILENLIKGCVLKTKSCRGFNGQIYPVNPKADKILGKKCYASLLDINDVIDIAIIAVPAKIVAKIMQDCAVKGIKYVIIISAGFSELGESGKNMQQDIMKIAKKAGIRIIGPNCLGFIRPVDRLNASFAPTMPGVGKVAFISQSGALADSVIDWAVDKGYGFSFIVSYGNQADLEVADFIEMAQADPETQAIALYIEGLKDGRRFMKIAKRVSKQKPIVVIKAGKYSNAAKAISSHTGSLAGSYDVYKAAFNECGVHIVETVEELFDVSKVLANFSSIPNKVAIVTNGGGCGVLAADYCEEAGVNLVSLKEDTLKKLDSSGKMHPAYSRRNPLDIVGDAKADRYKVAIETLLAENYISGLIVIQTLQTMTEGEKDAQVVIEAVKRFGKPIVCSFLGGHFTKKAGRMLHEANIPNYDDVSKAVKAMKSLVE